MSDNVHIIPLDDLRPHQASIDCACKPYRDPETDALIIHIAYDGREFAEEEERELINANNAKLARDSR
jgi:hypothetical protein